MMNGENLNIFIFQSNTYISLLWERGIAANLMDCIYVPGDPEKKVSLFELKFLEKLYILIITLHYGKTGKGKGPDLNFDVLIFLNCPIP